MGILKKYCKPHLFRIVLALILKAFSTGFTLFLPWAFTYLVNEIVPLNSNNMLITWGAVMILAALATMLLSLLAAHLSVKFGVDISKDIREDVFVKSCDMDCEKIDKFGISSVVSRLTTDISSVQVFISKVMTKGTATILTFVGSLLSVTILDLKLAVIMFAIVPLIAVTVYFTTKIGFKRFRETKKVNDSLVKVIRENVIGIRVIRALSTFERENNNFDEVNDLLRTKNIRASIVDAIGTPSMRLWVNLGMVATLMAGAYFVKDTQSDVASLIAFMSYFTMVLTSLIGIGQLFTMYAKCAAAASRISEVLDTENRAYEDKHSLNKHNKFIEFKNVSFSYGDDVDVLNNISFSLEKGETLGIIGSTGSGKSTIISLMLRLYEPDSGEIFLDGKPINSYSKEKLYQKFGVVFQSDIIFAESVSENIAFGRDISDDQIMFASESAQAKVYVDKLKDKYNTLINIRGQNMSGGEKQRMLISRALAGKPEVLVLDDATNALDYRTDANLRMALSKDYEGTTKIFVSQRVATIINANKIIVLDKGEIIAEGNHSILNKTCDIYGRISKAQLGDSALYA